MNVADGMLPICLSLASSFSSQPTAEDKTRFPGLSRLRGLSQHVGCGSPVEAEHIRRSTKRVWVWCVGLLSVFYPSLFRELKGKSSFATIT